MSQRVPSFDIDEVFIPWPNFGDNSNSSSSLPTDISSLDLLDYDFSKIIEIGESSMHGRFDTLESVVNEAGRQSPQVDEYIGFAAGNETTNPVRSLTCEIRTVCVSQNDEEGKTGTVSKKRKRAASHNQSERKRREKINQMIQTLHNMVPNSYKTDKASMLGQVFKHLKQLQAAEVNMKSPTMMLPSALQQQQSSVMAGNNICGLAPATAAFNLPPVPNLAVLDPLILYLASHSQPMNVDAYGRLAALYQQLSRLFGGFK